jgi:hypothetical protein
LPCSALNARPSPPRLRGRYPPLETHYATSIAAAGALTAIEAVAIAREPKILFRASIRHTPLIVDAVPSLHLARIYVVLDNSRNAPAKEVVAGYWNRPTAQRVNDLVGAERRARHLSYSPNLRRPPKFRSFVARRVVLVRYLPHHDQCRLRVIGRTLAVASQCPHFPQKRTFHKTPIVRVTKGPISVGEREALKVSDQA